VRFSLHVVSFSSHDGAQPRGEHVIHVRYVRLRKSPKVEERRLYGLVNQGNSKEIMME
jgi:hypothetical protein